MYSRRTRLSSLRTVLAFVICVALLALPKIPLLVSGAAQGQSEALAPKAKPRPGRPEGVLPDLEAIKNESGVEREAPLPIPSTIRSPKIPLQPWNGRRVGDPGTQLAQGVGEGNNLVASNKRRTRLAHVRRKMLAPPPVPDDQFIQNFFTWAVLRAPSGTEPTFWNDQFRVAYAQGQISLKLAAVELGKTLFESAEYAARTRADRWYVYDLYKTFLMREPDAAGWAYWESVVPANGRENVRRAFEVCSEFDGIVNSITPNGSASPNAASLISARVDPRNQPGNGMLTRDASWSVPLISLPGRAGLDLGLTLSYSSMVWTRSGPYIHFDEDNGFPSPGFRLGFPTVQRKVFDAQTARNSFLLVTPAGQRVQLRQVGTSNIYEAADSSYLQLTDNSPYLLLRATDGTQLSFVEINNEYSCTQVKDRNGNYITINHNYLGRIATITDTLGRVITFNYDVYANLISITQSWNGQPAHQWVSFGWGTRTMQSSFSDPSLRGVIGPANGTVLPVITQVALNDTSYFTFDYTNSLQVSVMRNYFGSMERNSTTFTYEPPAGDAPRLVDSRVSADNWTGINGVPSPVITQYSVAGDGACVLTAPDGTVYKEYYGIGWQRGLTTLSEVWSGGMKQKWTTMTWTQDNTSVTYEVNPRVTETNVFDAGGNRRRTTISYYPTTSFSLPSDVFEYAANASTVLRHTHTNYNLNPTYTDRRIIGLPAGKYIFDGSGTLYQFDVFDYDYGGGFLTDTPQTPTQHDPSYGGGFVAGRCNLSIIRHTDVINPANPVHDTLFVYNKTGSVTSTIDPLGHTKSISYTDSFSDAVNRNTFAYPTTLTDEDGFSSYLQYNFDFGATTRSQSPAPAAQSQGAIQTMTYNNLGQLERTTTTNNGAYTRYIHGSYYVQSFATINNIADEAYNIQVFDGVGRVRATAANHPGSTGGYRAQLTIYDLMGRAVKTSNPSEITGTWVRVGDDVAGWLYTQQSYDWKGRPLVTTNQDGTAREASYSGCGCAGGEVVTLTDEGTIVAGIAKHRQQRIYSDVLGRTIKTEILNWQNGSIYSATVNTYNVRDQAERIRQYAGAEGSGTYQDTTMTYDGYGRLKTKHVSEENDGTNTTWNYNADDSVNTITDARGATTTFGYTGTNRGLMTTATHTMSGSPAINVSYNYAAVGNRTSMTDAAGTTTYTYNQLSQLTSEARTFNGVSGSYALNYAYNLAGQLSSLSIPFSSQQVGYNYDAVGRLSGMTASGFTASYYDWQTQQNYSQSVTSFLSNILYRAWGAKKSMTYGNTVTDSISYNSRLQAATYSISNVKYMPQPPTTYTSMSWTYDYSSDGRLRFVSHPVENRWDRFYAYDHAARLKEADTNRIARGQSWDFWNPDPYQQTIAYDNFGHITSRTGRLYRGFPSDTASYTKNRRSDWSYDAAGNVTNDQSYTHIFDALGKNVHTISQSIAGNGTPQFPSQPVIEITQTYDGQGVPGKRVQRTRMNVYDEFDPEHPLIQVLEDIQTSYYLRSTPLGNRTIVELIPDGTGGATKKLVNIYAGDLKVAREWFGAVEFEHHIPSTGSWIVTSGHSNNRAAWRQERDPSGAELPMSDPYESEYSYPSMKFQQPLFI